MDGVVSSDLVVWHALVFTGIFIFVEALSKHISKWIEVLVVLIVVVSLLRFVRARLQGLVLFKCVVDEVFEIVALQG